MQDYVYGAPDPAPPAKSNPDCSAVVEAGKPEWVHSRGLSSINTSQWDWPCQNVFQRDVKYFTFSFCTTSQACLDVLHEGCTNFAEGALEDGAILGLTKIIATKRLIIIQTPLTGS